MSKKELTTYFILAPLHLQPIACSDAALADVSHSSQLRIVDFVQLAERAGLARATLKQQPGLWFLSSPKLTLMI